MALDLGGDSAAPAQDAQLDVLVVGGARHVGAGEQHIAAVDDHGLGVELRLWRLAAVDGPVVCPEPGVGRGRRRRLRASRVTPESD